MQLLIVYMFFNKNKYSKILVKNSDSEGKKIIIIIKNNQKTPKTN